MRPTNLIYGVDERPPAQVVDGTLEGDITVEYSGQLDIEMKNLNDDDSPEQREQNLRDEIKQLESQLAGSK